MAYKQAKRINFRMLYALIFAFTTGIHLYGDQERQLRQLETGRDMTKLLGGQEREDEVGQPILGYWYTFKLISGLPASQRKLTLRTVPHHAEARRGGGDEGELRETRKENQGDEAVRVGALRQSPSQKTEESAFRTVERSVDDGSLALRGAAVK